MSGREFGQFALLETRQEAGATVSVPSDIFGIEFADLNYGVSTSYEPASVRTLADVARPTLSL